MSEKNLLEIKDLHVNVEDKEILHGVNLEVGKDEVHVLMEIERNRKIHPGLCHHRASEICHHIRTDFL